MNRKKRGLALLLCICMLFTLMPMAAFADGTSNADVVYGSYDSKGDWSETTGMTAATSEKTYKNDTTGASVKYSKTAESKGNDLYDITLKIESETNPGASAVVLVIDKSGSMAYCAECGSSYHGSNKGHTFKSRLDSAAESAKQLIDSYGANGSNRYLSVVAFSNVGGAKNFETGFSSRSSTYWVDVSNSTYREQAKNQLVGFWAADGGTNLEDGLDQATTLLNSDAVKSVANENKFVVVLTDGKPTYSSSKLAGGIAGALGVREPINGDGGTTSETVYTETVATATTLKGIAGSVYTVCYGAANDSLDCNNMTVSTFLSEKIASSEDKAYNAGNSSDLTTVFENIINSIETGLSSGFTVTDPMGGMVTLQNTTLTDCTIANDTITWNPTAPTDTKVDEKTGKTTYIFELTYTVKLNTEADGFESNKYYPTNGNTTLSFVDGNDTKTLQFNVPGVKGVKPTYTVTYQYDGTAPDGAALPTQSTVQVQKDDEHTVATPTAVPGWTFNGWKTSDVTGSEMTYVGGDKFNMPNNNVTLVGSWTENPTYGVTYQWADSSNVPSTVTLPNDNTKYETGNTVTVAAAPSATGWTFNGWTTTSSGVTVGTDGKFTMPGNDVEFVGTWTQNQYKVTYQYTSTNNPSDESAQLPGEITGKHYGDEIDVTVPSADGWTFSGWTSDQVTVGTNGKFNMPASDVTLTGSWTKLYNVSYQYVGADGKEIKSLNGVTLTAPIEGRHQENDKFNVADYTSVPGYTFSGWTYNSTAYETNAQFTMPGNAVEFVGKFTPQSGIDYTINYYWIGDKDDNTGNPKTGAIPFHYETGTATFGQTITAPTLSTDLDAQYKIVPGQSNTLKIESVTGNVLNLYYYKNVVLQANSATYTYDGNVKTVTGFTSYLATDTAKKNLNLTFNNLSAYGEGTDVNTDPGYPVQFRLGGEEIIPVANVVGKTDNTEHYYVTAAFEGVLKITGTYKVSYVFAGDVPSGVTVPETSGWLSPSDPYTVLPIPSAVAGYTFVGWTTSDVTGTEQTYVGGNTFNMPEKNVVLVGTWTHDKYTVTYEYADGAPTNAPKVPDAKDYYYDAVVTVEDKPTLDGWIFTGWTVKNDDGTSKTYKGGDTFNMPEGNVTLVGSWEKIPYTPPTDTGIYTKIIVKITGNSASEVYDGTEKSVEGYTVEISDPRYTEKDFKFTGTAEAKGTFVGEYPMGLEADQFVNINRRFKNVEFIIVEDGVLTITARPITITAGSAEGWVTDCPITCDEWTSTPPAPGDTVVSVKITGVQNGPGSSPNVPSDAVIKNEAGKDVTDNYDITYVNGLLVAKDLLEKEDHFNYVIGYPDGSVQPNGNITRAEVATIFYRLLTDEARAKYTTTDNSFSDIKAGEWYTKAIATLENANIIGGYPDGTFKPNAPITRAEMATIIAKFANLDENGKSFNDIKGHWAQSYVELAAGNGWINGYEDGTFRPDKNITRAETFAMINRVLDRQVESVDDLLPTSQMNMWSDNLDPTQWYYKDVQEATNYHKCDRVNESKYETWTEKVPDIDWAKIQY